MGGTRSRLQKNGVCLLQNTVALLTAIFIRIGLLKATGIRGKTYKEFK
jgi:hypothetical protein